MINMNRLEFRQLNLDFVDTCRNSNSIREQYKVRSQFLIHSDFEGNTDIYLQDNLEYYE